MKLKISQIYSGNFKKYINKSKAVSSSLYFKLSPKMIFSNIHNESRSVVKFLEEPISEIFEIEGELDGTIQVCFYDNKKVLNALNFLDPESTKGEIEYEQDPDQNDDYLAKKVVLTDGNLKINLECSDPSLGFIHLEENKKQKLISTDNSVFSFDLMAMEVSRVKQLNKFDSEQEFTIYANDKGVHSYTSSYETTIDEEPQEEHEGKLLKKDHLDFLDEETYTVYVNQNSVLFISQDSDTKVVISVAKSA